MPDEENSPFSLKGIETPQILAAINVRKSEAHEAATKAKVTERFGFNSDEQQLFEIALAKYITSKAGGEVVRDRKNLLLEPIRILMEHGLKIDEVAVKSMDEEMRPLLQREVNNGEYLPNSIVNAANLISSLWFKHKKEGANFEEEVEAQAEYIKGHTLTRK